MLRRNRVIEAICIGQLNASMQPLIISHYVVEFDRKSFMVTTLSSFFLFLHLKVMKIIFLLDEKFIYA
jgi:hypothetical protein